MKSQNIFLVNSNDMSANLSGIFNRLLKTKFGEQVVDIREIPGGINSEAYKICTDHGNEYFGKFYRRRKGDSRNRLTTEFGAIAFLWQKGVKNISEPLLASEEDGLAIYRFIKGLKIKPGEITKSDIDEAADFAIQVHSLTNSEGAGNQPIASEACFSVKEYLDCVDGRVSKLRQVIKEGLIFNSLSTYLEDEFMPFFNIIKKEAERKARNLGLDMDEKLHQSKRTLSVSDFGFHNAIRLDSGKLFFFDFEYYGWDDPVKMIADFYLQPAVQVPVEYRVYFFKKVMDNYQEGAELEKRLSMIYPILGLKWCLIILNIFSRVDEGQAKEGVFFEHLDKSIKKFKEIKHEVETGAFPIILA